MSSLSGILYVGVTNNIAVRVWQHKMRLTEGFTQKYNCTRLVYYEEHNDINQAIQREKQLKRWNRKKKEDLIKTLNPEWIDLLEEPDISR